MRTLGVILPGLLAVAAGGAVFGLLAADRGWFPAPQLRAAGWLADPAAPASTAAPPGADTAARPGSGMWHDVPEAVRAAVQASAEGGQQPLADLANLPYLRGSTVAQELASITLHDPDATAPGLNLVLSGHAPVAELQDLKGRTLHRWQCAFDDVWPDGLPYKEAANHKTFWRRVFVYPDGELLAIFEGWGLVKLDADSNLVWANPGRQHHDLDVRPDGRIYTLTRHARPDPAADGREGPPLYLRDSYLDDAVTILTAEGETERSVSLLECFERSDYRDVLMYTPKVHDILHANTVEVMDGNLAELHPMYAAGHVLVSLLTIDTIAMVDLDARRVVWAAAGLARRQHQPTVLANGNILVFDNVGDQLSQVLEFDPATMELAWVYRGTEEDPFSSFRLGSCQRLANGNTLITESTGGRAFEVRPDGAKVWEWVNPHRAGPEDGLIATLFEVVRLPPDYFTGPFAELSAARDELDMGGVDRLLEGLTGEGDLGGKGK